VFEAEFCESGHLIRIPGYCEICNRSPKPQEEEGEDDESVFSEVLNCRRCDSPNRSNPKRKTYACPVCLYRSNKERWPRYRFGLEPREEDESAREFEARRWEQLREFKKFKKLQWGKIPKERRREIKSKKDLSDDFLRFYGPFIDWSGSAS
jgi:hypothetical protein